MAIFINQQKIATGPIIVKLDRNTSIQYYEKAFSGIDGELGYALTNDFTVYVGGYYFHGSAALTSAGPKMRFTYDYQPSHRRVLGIVDLISIEAGVWHDQPRGSSGYIGVRFKVALVNLEKNNDLAGFERHMVELVRRDPDIVIVQTSETRKSVYQSEANGSQVRKEHKEKFSLWSMEDLLKELDLAKDASLQDLIKRYRKLALTYHPDRNRGEEATFIHYTEIYEILIHRFGGSKGKINAKQRAKSEVMIKEAQSQASLP